MDGKPVKKPVKMQNQVVLEERKKDRGDSFKKQDGTKSKISDLGSTKLMRKPALPDQGDVPIINKNTKTHKTINNNKMDKVTTENVKKQIDSKPKLSSPKINTAAEKMSLGKTSEINNAVVNKTKIGEKNASDKISLRSKLSNNQNQSKDSNKTAVKSDLKTERLKCQASLKSGSKEIITDTVTPSTKVEADVIKKVKDTAAQRKAMIKTIKSKNDNKVYKAVTFTEQKHTKPTVLEINMPNIQAKKTKPKLVDKNLEVKIANVPMANNKSTSKLNIKEKSQHHRRNRLTERIRRKKLNRSFSSPDKFKKAESPPTEVAKWAPSCLNSQTKPYYEAWVNTTLAAITKLSSKEKMYLEKKNIIKTFQKSLNLREKSPELVHEDFTDETYTGRIKIKQKKLPRRTRQPLITPLLDNEYTFKKDSNCPRTFV